MDISFETYWNTRRDLVNKALEAFVIAPSGCPQELIEAMRYSVLAPGKRLRPILTIAGSEAVGGSVEQVIPTACALELIHAFSLVHDDLPALDNDDLRRGRPTSHVKFGEAMAILAGDALFAQAFDLIGRNVEFAPADRVVRVLKIVAEASGTDGMVAGQVMDILSEGQAPEAERVDYIHSRKTAALIQAAVVSGAILSGADEEQISRLELYGSSIGVAFQVTDDILNVTGDASELGKATGSDVERGKSTYPALYGLDKSIQVANELVIRAKEALVPFGAAAQPLLAIADLVTERRT